MDPGMELLRDGHKASRVMTSRKTEIGLVYLDFSDFLMGLIYLDGGSMLLKQQFTLICLFGPYSLIINPILFRVPLIILLLLIEGYF